ncbi:MAG: hypothetical protein ABIR66_03535 [Saprospiraceae bacterium]
MNRRKFIQNSAIAAAGTIGVPYLLPSGLLFAQQAPIKAQHVVFVQFAGGLRQQESVLQRYLAGSQNEQIEGNIMYNLLDGLPPEDKIAYGTDDIKNNIVGAFPINPILQTPLQKLGTLFPEVHFSKGGASHFNGLSTGVSGNYYLTAGLRQRTTSPTIFEYLRRHAGFKATDCWSIANSLTGSRSLLNYSVHKDYGRRYAGNFIAPSVTFGAPGKEHLMDFKNYHPDTDYEMFREIRGFLNQNFTNEGLEIPHLYNTPEEENSIREFIRQTFEKIKEGRISSPPISDNGDLVTLGYTVEVLRWFKPRMTVVDLNNIDVCHSDFTGYLKNIHRADHGIGFLWKEIQAIPEMRDNTIMIVMPEHGRDEKPNSIKDLNDWYAYDHSGSPNAKRIFNLMVGPGVDANLKRGSEQNPLGDAADVVPTIADIFGIKETVYNAGFLDSGARSLFDRI